MINRITSSNVNLFKASTQQTNEVKKEEKLSRVEEIKKAIENGSYKVDINKTAKAMAKNLL